MQRYIVQRLLQSVVALLLLSVAIFVLVRATGDPVLTMLPADATQEDIRNLRESLGLDKPYSVQYGLFMANAIKGDFGKSLRSKWPVSRLLAERLPNSARLAGASLVITLIVGFPLGVIAAVRRGTKIATLVAVVAVLGQSMPSFWLAIVFIEIFSVKLGILPVSGIGGVDHYILPALTMGWFLVAGVTRLLRSSLIEALDSEFVKMARIKGVSERGVIWRHALRNALIPVVTFGGMYFAILLTASIVVETVFAWPGVGRLVYEGLMYRDFPVVQGVVIVAAFLVVMVNLVVDILYAYVDPRIRYGQKHS